MYVHHDRRIFLSDRTLCRVHVNILYLERHTTPVEPNVERRVYHCHSTDPNQGKDGADPSTLQVRPDLDSGRPGGQDTEG